MATTDRLQGFNIGSAVKPACVVATTASVTLSGEQTIDGITVGSSERVLVKDQATASENGIYLADSSTWTRARDFDGNKDAIPGTIVYVDRGAASGASLWAFNSSSTTTKIAVGTDDITLTNISFSITVAGIDDGNVTTPGLAFNNDVDTGFYRIGDDEIGVAVGGIKALGIAESGSSATHDFNDHIVSKFVAKDYAHATTSPTISSSAITFNLADGNDFDVTLNANIATISVTNWPSTTNRVSFLTAFTQNSTGGHTVSFPSTWRYAGGAHPTVSSSASAYDEFAVWRRGNIVSFQAIGQAIST